jgi:hypothetical protein
METGWIRAPFSSVPNGLRPAGRRRHREETAGRPQCRLLKDGQLQTAPITFGQAEHRIGDGVGALSSDDRTQHNYSLTLMVGFLADSRSA